MTENKAKTEVENVESKAKAYSKKKEIEADVMAELMEIEAKARLDAARMKKDALIKEAQAEGSVAAKLEGKRRHEERLLKTQMLISLAKNARLVVSGENGQKILDFFRNALASNK